ncbi:MAG: YraN family protein [Spirochaetaceae bacterium]|nr:YraN family protein [Spirochaetaceae bacterium]
MREPVMGLTFEKVWAMFQETDRKMQETDRKMQETDRLIGRLGSRLGDLIEHLTASDIIDRFNEKGYRFLHISRNHRIKDEANQVMAEIDILLENGDYVMVVEVKTNLTKTDVKNHLKRMDVIKRDAQRHGDKRKYIGSVAGALLTEGAREYALSQGFYVIEHPGQTVEITAPKVTHEW